MKAIYVMPRVHPILKCPRLSHRCGHNYGFKSHSERFADTFRQFCTSRYSRNYFTF